MRQHQNLEVGGDEKLKIILCGLSAVVRQSIAIISAAWHLTAMLDCKCKFCGKRSKSLELSRTHTLCTQSHCMTLSTLTCTELEHTQWKLHTIMALLSVVNRHTNQKAQFVAFIVFTKCLEAKTHHFFTILTS